MFCFWRVKTILGKNKVCVYCGTDHIDEEGYLEGSAFCEECLNVVRLQEKWKVFAKAMVISDDPIQYIKSNIGGDNAGNNRPIQ